jgi:hypothetical protein
MAHGSHQDPGQRPPRASETSLAHDALGARLDEISASLQRSLVDLDAASEQRRAALARLAAQHGLALEGESPADADRPV